jgi:16S rRNA (cytosine1402-N4)-methyltransferase
MTSSATRSQQGDNPDGHVRTWQPEPGHITVLLNEAVQALNPIAGGVYVDATFGGGGHTSLLLEQEPAVGQVIGIDADLSAAERARSIEQDPRYAGRFSLAQTNFRHLGQVVAESGRESVDGVLFDLGVSSFQFDEGERGFSFRFDAPLDMRFDQSGGRTAADIVNQADQQELAHIIWTFGEERKSRQIAARIVRERETAPIQTTGALMTLVERAVGGRRGAPIHPATRTFQALRIAVNHELDALAEALQQAVNVLSPGGRLVVISFHSLEDRIVKRFIEDAARTCVCPPDQPICTCDTIPVLRRIGKPVRPGQIEIDSNPRSRSAIMRVAERLDAAGDVAIPQGTKA